jgi:protein SCO1/2
MQNPLRQLAFALAALLVFPMAVPLDAAASEVLTEFDRVRLLSVAREMQPFEVINQDGEPFNSRQLRGKVSLVFFGFTNCPDICPTTLASWSALQSSGAIDLSQVNFVLISVDGERDTPDVMKEYLEKFSGRFIGLTDDPAKIKKIAKPFSAAFFKGNPTIHEGHYDVSHSPQAFVLDANGDLRAEFYSPTIEAMAGTIDALLDESTSPGVAAN